MGLCLAKFPNFSKLLKFSKIPKLHKLFIPLTQIVKKWWLLCIVKLRYEPKNTATMKLNYTIDCNHCGAHTEYSSTICYRNMSVEDVERKMHIDTECAMRCPVCRYRLNTTEADFRSQVHVTREA